MTTHSDDHFDTDLGRDIEHNMRRARIAGYVLLVGLFLEVVSCIIWFHGVETLASMICVALVAGGVAGEIFFEYRARLADKGTPIAAPSIREVEQPEPGYSWSRTSVTRTGVHGLGELVRVGIASPNKPKLLPTFPERARRSQPPRRRERFASSKVVCT